MEMGRVMQNGSLKRPGVDCSLQTLKKGIRDGAEPGGHFFFLIIEVILAHCRKCEKPNNIQN